MICFRCGATVPSSEGPCFIEEKGAFKMIGRVCLECYPKEVDDG